MKNVLGLGGVLRNKKPHGNIKPVKNLRGGRTMSEITQIDKTPENYFIHWESGQIYMQRYTTTSATANPLDGCEKLIIDLCEVYLNNKKSTDADTGD